MTEERIKEIMLAAGFEIKPGLTDLKPYCYTAARAIEAEVSKEQAEKIAELEAKVEKGRNIVRNDMHRAGQYQARIDDLERQLAEARKALSSINQYGSDTLFGRVDGPDDRQ